MSRVPRIKKIKEVEVMNRKEYLQDTYSSYNNPYTGMGTSLDTDRHTKFMPGVADDTEITNLYRFMAPMRKAISLPISDMFRNGITFEQDPDNGILAEMNRLSWKKHFIIAKTWEDTYGGSVIIKGIDDGKKYRPDNHYLETPANMVKGIKWLKVYDRRSLSLNESDIEYDLNSPNYGNYNYLYISNAETGIPVKIHWSRFILFDGILTPDFEKRILGFGDSLTNLYYKRVMDLDNSYYYVKQILRHAFKKIFINPALNDLLDAKRDDLVYRRAQLQDLTDESSNSIYLGKGEEFRQMSISLTGSTDIVRKFEVALCMAADIPESRFFGTTSGGMNTTKEQEMKYYYMGVASRQNFELTDKINNLVNNISGYVGKSAEEAKWEFVDLNQLTTRETVELRERQAKIDEIYVKNGILSPDEIRKSRFINGYSWDYIVSGPAPDMSDTVMGKSDMKKPDNPDDDDTTEGNNE